MDDHAILQRLLDWGHFRNPAYPDCHGVESVEKLDLSHALAVQAVRSYQEFFAGELDRVCRVCHRRGIVTDGQVGPATLWLLDQPRCSLPDFRAGAEANWPDGCRLDITVSYSFDELNLDATSVRKAWDAALASWEKVIAVRFSLKPEFSKQTRIWATDGPLPGSTLAWSQLAESDCNARLEQRYDTLQAWEQTYLQATICHEVGHALGSEHLRTADAIMYPSITSIVVPQLPDIQNMVQLGYKRRAEPEPPPPPPPGPDPDPTPWPWPPGKKVKGEFLGRVEGLFYQQPGG
jgi:hypothetical protein